VSLVVAISRLASWAGLSSLLVALIASRTLRRGPTGLRRFSMGLATFALGMALFALFFGLVAACDRL
jgi:hypothetical protein